MNKEEIKKAIKIIFNEECKKCYFPRKRSCESCLKENRKKIRKYIKELEQKESILDKVTEKLKEDIDSNYCIEKYLSNEYGITGKTSYSVKSYAREILNFIEGENK